MNQDPEKRGFTPKTYDNWIRILQGNEWIELELQEVI